MSSVVCGCLVVSCLITPNLKLLSLICILRICFVLQSITNAVLVTLAVSGSDRHCLSCMVSMLLNVHLTKSKDIHNVVTDNVAN